jgi:hypothetical protein
MTLSTSDWQGLYDLIARYNYAWDTGDYQGWADTFVEEGHFTGPYGSYEGRGNLADFARRSTVDRPEGFVPMARQHWNSNILFESPEDGVAKGRCYLVMVARQADGAGIIDRVGWYENECRRDVDGTWKFSRRVVCGATEGWPGPPPSR